MRRFLFSFKVPGYRGAITVPEDPIVAQNRLDFIAAEILARHEATLRLLTGARARRGHLDTRQIELRIVARPPIGGLA